jgi:hypothetical protein
MANIPSRKANALSGSEFFRRISSVKSASEIDDYVCQEILSGNIPDFLRNFVAINVESGGNKLTYNVMPNYLCVGSDEDWVMAPLGAVAAQRVADAFGCTLTTKKMANQIYNAADVKLTASPIPPSSRMTQNSAFLEHSDKVKSQMQGKNQSKLFAGHKKDVILSNNAGKNGKLGIYGFFDKGGKAIQSGDISPHDINYRDYSHGIRLVDRNATLNGKQVDLLNDVIKSPQYSGLVIDGGPLTVSPYKSNNEKTKEQTKPLSLMDSPSSKSQKEKKPYDAKSDQIALNEPRKNEMKGRSMVLNRLDAIFRYLEDIQSKNQNS